MANTWAPSLLDDFKEDVNYDANGNILSYLRNGSPLFAGKSTRWMILPSVESGMMYVAETIKKRGGDLGRWHNMGDDSVNRRYRENYKKAVITFDASIIRQMTQDSLNEK